MVLKDSTRWCSSWVLILDREWLCSKYLECGCGCGCGCWLRCFTFLMYTFCLVRVCFFPWLALLVILICQHPCISYYLLYILYCRCFSICYDMVVFSFVRKSNRNHDYWTFKIKSCMYLYFPTCASKSIILCCVFSNSAHSFPAVDNFYILFVQFLLELYSSIICVLFHSLQVLQEVLRCYSIPENLFGKVCVIIDKVSFLKLQALTCS